MNKINKIGEPISLTTFKINNPTLVYGDLTYGNEFIRKDIRVSCVKEQYYLCVYCCDRITLSSCHNEHIIPQSHSLGQTLTLDYNNIVASCQSSNHCGHKKKNQLINLTPLDLNCENDIIYQLNGKMTHTTPDAQQTISVLNLRNNGLVYKRRTVIDLILFEYVDDLNDLKIENKEYLEEIIADLSQPDLNGKLEAFSPVIINVIKQIF